MAQQNKPTQPQGCAGAETGSKVDAVARGYQAVTYIGPGLLGPCSSNKIFPVPRQFTMGECSIDVHNVWGPQVHGCGTDFDLTLLFQEIILSIWPLAIAICWALWRIWQLHVKDGTVASPMLYSAKAVSASTPCGSFRTCSHVAPRGQVGYISSINLQISLLTIQALLRTSRTDATITANCLGVVGTAILAAASHYEHTRTPRASTLLLVYLGYSTVADALRARTLSSIVNTKTAAAIFILCCVCKFGILVAERWRKSVHADIHKPTPDEQADIISRAFLWWVVPLFGTGRNRAAQPLTLEKLPNVERKLVHPVLVASGAGEGQSLRSLRGPSIFHDMFVGRGWMLVSPVIPRLAYIGFTFAQPFLVHRATEYMSEPAGPNIYKIGGGLIGVYTIVYVGISVRIPAVFLYFRTLVYADKEISRHLNRSIANVLRASSRRSGRTWSERFIAIR